MSYPTRLFAKDEMTLRDWFAGQTLKWNVSFNWLK